MGPWVRGSMGPWVYGAMGLRTQLYPLTIYP